MKQRKGVSAAGWFYGTSFHGGVAAPAVEVAPRCECGESAVVDGAMWVCGNRACGGFGQIIRERRA